MGEKSGDAEADDAGFAAHAVIPAPFSFWVLARKRRPAFIDQFGLGGDRVVLAARQVLCRGQAGGQQQPEKRAGRPCGRSASCGWTWQVFILLFLGTAVISVEGFAEFLGQVMAGGARGLRHAAFFVFAAGLAPAASLPVSDSPVMPPPPFSPGLSPLPLPCLVAFGVSCPSCVPSCPSWRRRTCRCPAVFASPWRRRGFSR